MPTSHPSEYLWQELHPMVQQVDLFLQALAVYAQALGVIAVLCTAFALTGCCLLMLAEYRASKPDQPAATVTLPTRRLPLTPTSPAPA